MRYLFLCGVLSVALPGCSVQTGHGLWNLKVGSEARLVSTDGSDITIETLPTAIQGKASRRPARRVEAEKVTLSAGTTVVILAIDGDDARVEIKQGPRKGSIYWVECARLEPVSP